MACHACWCFAAPTLQGADAEVAHTTFGLYESTNPQAAAALANPDASRQYGGGGPGGGPVEPWGGAPGGPAPGTPGGPAAGG